LGVGAQLPARVGAAGFRGEIEIVDDVAPIAGQGGAVAGFGRRAARFGELARHPPNFDHWAGSGKGQDDRHLQQYSEGVGDGALVKIGEALGAIAALEQKSPTGGDFGQLMAQGAYFAAEHQRQRMGQPLFGFGQRRKVVVDRQLRRRPLAPTVRSPGVNCPESRGRGCLA